MFELEGVDVLHGLRCRIQNPESKLAVLEHESNDMSNADAAVLATGLSGNSTLKKLCLSYNKDITETGWRAIFTSL